MPALDLLAGFALAFAIATVTAPVGVSGAVFLLPAQVSLLGVPNPAVTPTNLLYNVVATPGALWRYHRHGGLGGPLVRLLALGTLPGVVVGAVIRVELVPGPDAFRILIAALLAPLGAWLLLGRRTPPGQAAPAARGADGEPLASRDGTPLPNPRRTLALALAVGVVGGVYGIGGGSILGPLLVAGGLAVATVAPAALAATFLTSLVGALAYGLLALLGAGDGASIAPEWGLGLLLGLGGLLGGYLGARLQPRAPEALLRRLLGALALGLALAYLLAAAA